ncbi:hypothetical protein L6164_010254 [Bauhinia variegata]|uniref:Uncharacterized protein n=1 Tax=Bauhinia variegata TaxID=167791 RepID=A0ACB9PLQ8_BAUVA|nr:hypothetical protein L6164_010254 [Bauhinia variegata]
MAFSPIPLLAIYVLLLSSATDTYSTQALQKPKSEHERLLSTTIAIQGIVYCKSGSKLLPLQGAVTRITCEVADKYGFEMAPFSFLSGATDEKGYFFATLCPSEVADKGELHKCRAFLEMSPLDNCSVPTDENKGISGAELDSYRFLSEKKMKLYTLRPFFFTSEQPTSASPSDGY